MTTWGAVPMIISSKYSYPINNKVNLGVGLLFGTGSWAFPEDAIALPFGSLTYGDRRKNLTMSCGYVAAWSWTGGGGTGRTLFSVAGMSKVSSKISLVFDSFIVPGFNDNDGGALLLPGIRLHTDITRAFQFGFGGLYMDGEFLPAPIPFIQWFKKL
jgi:hypothetical protein